VVRVLRLGKKFKHSDRKVEVLVELVQMDGRMRVLCAELYLDDVTLETGQAPRT
jgi:hypothetical protein